MFCFDHGTHKDKFPNYITDIEKAQFIRQELINNGWKKLIPPEVTFTFPGEKEARIMNRKEKRYLKKKMKSMNKQNPFDQPPTSEGSPST